MQRVDVRCEKVIIPTYETGDYDKNPMFLEKRVYQGSSGRVYPHPVCEKVADVKTDKEYQAVFLENEYILVMILPELGGRIQRLLDKTNGYDAVYYNEVIKPALVGLAGPWISGGIEFNWPQHHRPSTYDPVDYKVEEREDGAVTVWVGETEKMFHTKELTGFTVYPDKAYLEIKGQIYNPTDRPQTFLWWANPAVAVNENTRSIFPPDVTAVYDHGKRDVSKFPIADGVYYKVDYAPGTDISRYKNIPVPTSYMAYHSDYDFIGNYDDGKRAGLLHIADHHVSPGKKQWTWGNGDFGKAWDRNLTDENGPYIELMTGVFTDNQPDFTFIKPYEEKSFTQYFMPYKNAGAVKNASLDVFLNMEYEDGKICIWAYAPQKQDKMEIELLYDGQIILSDVTDLSPVQTYYREIPSPRLEEEKLCLQARKEGKVILSYIPQKVEEQECPEPAKPLPAPEKLETTEKLFLAAVHLEQYRHATYSPQDYYLEGLRRDNQDIRLNHGYGKYLYQKGLYEQALPYVEQAVKSATWKNPNPYDCEPYYTLGLILQKLGRTEESFDAFYKSAWDGAMQDKAFYKLACITAQKGEYEQAYTYIEQALQRGTHHLKARAIKTALLRRLGKTEQAEAFCRETMEIDPLDHAGAFEAMKLGIVDKESVCRQMRYEAHNAIELSITYQEAGFMEEAKEALLLYPDSMTPMSYYYLYEITGDKAYLQSAEQQDSSYCFPNRLEDIEVLTLAVEQGAMFAAFYLGNLYYDRGRFDEAAGLWEASKDKIAIPTAYRNLALYYYNKKHDAQKAKKYLEIAFSKNEKDARVFFELDQLYKVMNMPVQGRLEHMEKHKELLELRDDLYTEYLTLLNLTGNYKKAYEGMQKHIFHPWEGGEGKITTQYRYACMRLAEKEQDNAKKIELLQKGLVYPYNLGEGKLAGNLDNDIYYFLGECCKATDAQKAENYFRLAARGNGELHSAMYYNDQPPQMQYYAALAKKELGMEKEAEKQFRQFIEYGEEHAADDVKIDYFAVSLPDFLIFEGNLNVKNKVHCHLMKALGYLGLGRRKEAEAEINHGLALECCHEMLLQLKEVCNI